MFPPIGPPPLVPIYTPPIDPELTSAASTSDETLLRYHHTTILPLITTVEASLDTFAALCESQRHTSIGQGLQNALFALSARHLANKGEMRHEVSSQKKEDQAREKLFAKVAEWEMGVGVQWDRDEKWALTAGLLTLIRVKVGSMFARTDGSNVEGMCGIMNCYIKG